jgi:hypothetical protein
MENLELKFETQLSNLNYTKGEAGSYILKTIARSNTFGNITEYLNVKNNLVLQGSALGSTIIRNYTGDFSTDSATLTMKGVTLSPVEKEVVLSINRRQLKQLWDAEKFRAGWANTEPLPEFATFVSDYLSVGSSLAFENELWNSTGGTGNVVGIFKQAADDSDVVDVSGTTITEANVIAEIKKVYNAIPEGVKESGRAKIYLSSQSLAFYKMASGNQIIYTASLSTSNINRLFWDERIELVPITSIPNNKMLATHMQNIVFGTDALSDFNTVNIFDERTINKSDKFSMLMTFTGDIKLVWGADVVLYA